MHCPSCDLEVKPWTEGTTCVGGGYFTDDAGREHFHDPNCVDRVYACVCGTVFLVYRQATCETEGCDWRGKLTCFCHPGDKVAEWPDELLTEDSHEPAPADQDPP